MTGSRGREFGKNVVDSAKDRIRSGSLEGKEECEERPSIRLQKKGNYFRFIFQIKNDEKSSIYSSIYTHTHLKNI